MTYDHLSYHKRTVLHTKFLESRFKAYIVAKTLKRSAETIYRVYRFLDAGNSIFEYYENYRANKARSNRKPIHHIT